jgi:hypothetical protein
MNSVRCRKTAFVSAPREFAVNNNATTNEQPIVLKENAAVKNPEFTHGEDAGIPVKEFFDMLMPETLSPA